jgi:hypothetical protein
MNSKLKRIMTERPRPNTGRGYAAGGINLISNLGTSASACPVCFTRPTCLRADAVVKCVQISGRVSL